MGIILFYHDLPHSRLTANLFSWVERLRMVGINRQQGHNIRENQEGSSPPKSTPDTSVMSLPNTPAGFSNASRPTPSRNESAEATSPDSDSEDEDAPPKKAAKIR